MKPVCFLFSHLNLQVLWFRLNFCHYFIVISTGFSFCIILMKEKEGTNRTRFWFSWYNYCLPLVLFSILSVALGSAPNSADVYFEGCESRFSNNKSGYELNRSEGGNEIEWYFETCRYLVRNDREFLFTFGFSFQFMMYELKMSTHSKIESLPRRSLRINVCSIVTVFYRHLLGEWAFCSMYVCTVYTVNRQWDYGKVSCCKNFNEENCSTMCK